MTMTNDYDELLNDLIDKGIEVYEYEFDKPIPYYDNSVPCGNPMDVGDIDGEREYFILPHQLVGNGNFFCLDIIGDSMKDAGFEEGDKVFVEYCNVASDGDCVLASIDGEYTIKVLYSDADGEKWLVPRNDNYDAIMISREFNVRICGKVIALFKKNFRFSSSSLLQSINRTKLSMMKTDGVSEEKVDEVIERMGDEIKAARHWYSVFWVLVNNNVFGDSEVSDFCERVRLLLPNHKHLPNPKELSRLQVQSFAKCVALWDPNDAPVSGSIFKKYLNIALMTQQLLN